MEEKNINCWEFKKCGREPGGKNVSKHGVCPAAAESRADGIHQGKNGGRCCWIISDSYCKINKNGGLTGKFLDCRRCEFYAIVKNSTELLVVA
ncbi:MAG: two-CW domain-containing protein [Candidatus Electrothrix aestuarii]|uniref:Two-CW domain-containing protein n=1 Tax=Candidatus Electrothrix aestuarii TaxID=3062594 RepID=A0AAU8M2I5_9BACT